MRLNTYNFYNDEDDCIGAVRAGSFAEAEELAAKRWPGIKVKIRMAW